MKRGAYLINTARGKICDRDAVVRACESGQLAGYAGDVWFPQPAPRDHPWRTMPHHGMTPHTSGTSLSAQARYAAGTREILECCFEGAPIREEYLIVDGGKLAGAGAHSYSEGDATGGSERGGAVQAGLTAPCIRARSVPAAALLAGRRYDRGGALRFGVRPPAPARTTAPGPRAGHAARRVARRAPPAFTGSRKPAQHARGRAARGTHDHGRPGPQRRQLHPPAQQIARLVPDGNGEKECDTTGTAAPDGYREADFNWSVALRLRRAAARRPARAS